LTLEVRDSRISSKAQKGIPRPTHGDASRRKIKHIIEENPKSTLVNIKPYRYSRHHKTDIEKLI
jgi:hypothetical protein